MNQIFHHILPFFLIILLGNMLKKYWLTGEEFWRELEKLSYFVLFPCALFNYISRTDLGASQQARLMMALLLATSLVGVGLVLYGMKKKIIPTLFTSIFQGSIRYNNYIFFGLSNALFGQAGITLAALTSAYMIIFTNTLSILVFSIYLPNNDRAVSPAALLVKRISTNPLIIASVIGCCCNYLGIEFNLGLSKFFDTLASAALAIGALTVGASLKFTITSSSFNYLAVATLTKLIIMPLVVVCCLKLFNIKGLAKEIGILCACLPTASTSSVLSRQLGGDPKSMSTIITSTTVISILSLSLVMYILV